MTDNKTMSGQIEFLKEYNARLYDDNKGLKYKLVASEKRVTELEQIINVLKKENSDLTCKQNNLQSEKSEAFKKIEVLQEYNRRLNEKLIQVRSISEKLR